ncbi:pao retrotransposon peptidase superfamily [Lasius niger]|uniref:Pao retrotransposon peptidase superfamily n=1 Tax=Lasius niger TaxID=67767 RepID=A0A0J7JZP0_LASNI|nr:pao retrotransposon peptidase superfamily [Lasius niger]
MTESDFGTDLPRLQSKKDTVYFLINEKKKKLEEIQRQQIYIEEDIINLNLYKESLIKLQEEWGDINKDIQEVIPITELAEEMIQEKEVEESIRKKLLEINRILSNMEEEEEKKENDKEMKKENIRKEDNIKLQNIQIKPFNGILKEYMGFKQQVRIAVEENKNLSEVEKFIYLKSLLSGNANEMIDGLDIKGESFKIALDILEKTYGDRDRIIKFHINSLTQVGKVTDSNNLFQLRRMLNNLNLHIRSLKTLEVTPEAKFINPLIQQLFPEDLQVLYRRQKKEEESVEEMLNFFERELQIKENIKEKTLNAEAKCFKPRINYFKPRGPTPSRNQNNFIIPRYQNPRWIPKPSNQVTAPSTFPALPAPPAPPPQRYSTGSPLTCYGCGKTGHIKKHCRAQKQN